MLPGSETTESFRLELIIVIRQGLRTASATRSGMRLETPSGMVLGNLPQSMGWLSQMVGTKSRAQGMRNADGRHPLGEVRLHGDNFGETSE